jgi:hypothetical protein
MKTAVFLNMTPCTLLDRHQNYTENFVSVFSVEEERLQIVNGVMLYSEFGSYEVCSQHTYISTKSPTPASQNTSKFCVISGFPREVDEICTILWNYARFLTLEESTDKLSRNVGKELPQYTAKYPSKVQISLWVLIDNNVRTSNLETRGHTVMFTNSCHWTQQL